MSTVSEVLSWWEPFHEQFKEGQFVDIAGEDQAFADLLGLSVEDEAFCSSFTLLCIEMLKGASVMQMDVFDRLCDKFRENTGFTGSFPWESQEILT